MDKRSRPCRRIVLIILGLSACIGISLLVFWAWVGVSLTGNACPADNRAAIEYAAEITLPASASNIHSRCGSWQGYWGQVSFRMPPPDLNTFLVSTRVETELTTCEKTTPIIPFPEDEIATGISAIAECSFGDYLNQDVWQQVFIDTSDKTSYMVYVLFGRG
jgi:hypothetical protein